MAKGRTPEVTEIDIIKAAKRVDDPCFKVGEVAEMLDVSDQTIRNHTQDLLKNDIVEKKRVGSGYIYWVV